MRCVRGRVCVHFKRSESRAVSVLRASSTEERAHSLHKLPKLHALGSSLHRFAMFEIVRFLTATQRSSRWARHVARGVGEACWCPLCLVSQKLLLHSLHTFTTHTNIYQCSPLPPRSKHPFAASFLRAISVLPPQEQGPQRSPRAPDTTAARRTDRVRSPCRPRPPATAPTRPAKRPRRCTMSTASCSCSTMDRSTRS